MHKPVRIKVYTPRTIKTYKSFNSLSRMLSGNGTTNRRKRIQRNCENGWGYIGNCRMRYADMRAAERIARRKRAFAKKRFDRTSDHWGV